MSFKTLAARQTLATVLIADDEPSMRLLVHATIESDDYKVVEAADGDEAWTLIKQYKPSLALLDVQMPGRTGLEILRSIKSDPSLNATRVILLTARDLQAEVQAGMTAGADFYLTKPFSLPDLVTRVEEALRLWVITVLESRVVPRNSIWRGPPYCFARLAPKRRGWTNEATTPNPDIGALINSTHDRVDPFLPGGSGSLGAHAAYDRGVRMIEELVNPRWEFKS